MDNENTDFFVLLGTIPLEDLRLPKGMNDDFIEAGIIGMAPVFGTYEEAHAAAPEAEIQICSQRPIDSIES